MKKVFFTSDTHFNHTNIAGPKVSRWPSGYRCFDSIEEMNNTLIDNINSMVGEDDILYHLGDFAFGDKTQIPILRSRIKCKTIFLCYGNHDYALSKYYRHCFTACRDMFRDRFDKQEILMCHEPKDVWADNHRGTIHLFGHVHGNYQNCVGQRMDVGVDTNKFFPYTLEEVIEFCKAKAPFLPDHHR